MADRHLLHKKKLYNLKCWLTDEGYPWYESDNPWQIIGIRDGDKRVEFIYDNLKTEHYSVPDPLIALITRFIKEF